MSTTHVTIIFPEAGSDTSTVWPGARLTGAVRPSSPPFDKWTTILKFLKAAVVVFSTVPTKP